MTRRLLPVAVFAVAMAFLEAAVVVYLRRLTGVLEPALDASTFDAGIAAIEVGREAATLVMLAALGWACGRGAASRVGFACFAFGTWDVFYYVWLKVLLGWPASLLTPDILFLIPLPWWGPVLAPVLIALLMAGAGAVAVAQDERGSPPCPGRGDLAMAGAGIVLALYAFMADSLAALPATAEQLAQLRPKGFSWGVYGAGLALMALGTIRPLVASGRGLTKPGARRRMGADAP